MTTELVVMNKNGVALAADSSIHVLHQFGQKVYDSADKLFGIRSDCPVAIMFYGTSDFMGLPWAIILAEYRKHLENLPVFDKVSDYAVKFVSFIEKEFGKNTFSLEYQEETFNKTVGNYLNELTSEMNFKYHRQIISDRTLDRDEFTEKYLNERVNQWKNAPDILCSLDVDTLDRKYGERISNCITEILNRMPKLPQKINANKKLKEILTLMPTKGVFPKNSSGIVFAGFGSKEIFPSLVSIRVEYLFEGKLKYMYEDYQEVDSTQIDLKKNVFIKGFGQNDVIDTFFRGIHPLFQENMIDFLGKYIDDYTKKVLNYIEELDVFRKEKLLELLGGSNNTEAITNLINDGKIKYSFPISESLGYLPLKELGELVEHLVVATSFQRRVLPEMATVGGPVDVVVVSKKDGLIWIKRKHYFEGTLNPHFFE